MKKIKQAIIVEGKYDKIKIKNLYDTMIIETDGFGIFRNKQKQQLIRTFAKENGIIVFTDSDGAGFVIRNFIKNLCNGKNLYNAYIPDIYGKERRKSIKSKEGKVGVEGVPDFLIMKAIEECTPCVYVSDKTETVSMSDMLELGVIGKDNSSYIRKKLCGKWQLPENMNGKSLLEVINLLYSYRDLQKEVSDILKQKESEI